MDNNEHAPTPPPQNAPIRLLPVLLPAALADIEVVADMTVVRCLASDVSISIEFNAGVSSVGSPGAAITGENRCRVFSVLRVD